MPHVGVDIVQDKIQDMLFALYKLSIDFDDCSKNTLDVNGGSSFGASYAGYQSAPTNGWSSGIKLAAQLLDLR